MMHVQKYNTDRMKDKLLTEMLEKHYRDVQVNLESQKVKKYGALFERSGNLRKT